MTGVQRLRQMPVDRLAHLASSATYGSVLVLAALSVISAAEVGAGYGAELVAGVGVATWVTHVFAELVGVHVHLQRPLGRHDVAEGAFDASPVLASAVLPALALLLGPLDVVTDHTARIVAIVVAMIQIVLIGILIARVAPSRDSTVWVFGGVIVVAALFVVLLTNWLGH